MTADAMLRALHTETRALRFASFGLPTTFATLATKYKQSSATPATVRFQPTEPIQQGWVSAALPGCVIQTHGADLWSLSAGVSSTVASSPLSTTSRSLIML